MVIIISNPSPITNEANIINALFEEGLEVLHIRKPEASFDEVSALIKRIDFAYHNQIALHQYHQLSKEFGINRLHFTEAKRKEMSEEALAALKSEGNILSTSFHQTEAISSLPSSFEYAFFGTVFNSISKQGYVSVISNGFVFPKKAEQPKVIALGGIDATNAEKAFQMGFDGVGLLGALWQQPQQAVNQFKHIKKICKDRLY